MEKHIPGSVECETSNGRTSVAWQGQEARYHVWIDIATLKIEFDFRENKRVIYKNPHLSIKTYGPGYFPTIRLDAKAKGNIKVVAAVFAELKERGLVQAAIAKEAEIKGKVAADQREHVRVECIKAAALDLHAALDKIISINGCSGGNKALVAEFKHIAAEALSKCEVPA